MTLAEVLQQTAPVSLLRRKAARLGLGDLDLLVSLAVVRGCRHHACRLNPPPRDPGRDRLSDDELAILLLSVSQDYDPAAIRCAAQLLKLPGLDPRRLAFLAIKEKAERPLAHVARAGAAHDDEARPFWREMLAALGQPDERPEPGLPHWSRFVSMPGYQRGGQRPSVWLNPRRT